MGTTLSGRLAAQREARFVGRAPEISIFVKALAEPEASTLLVHLYGPGGVGKSSLLRKFEAIASQAGSGVARVDASLVVPTPDEFVAIVRNLNENDKRALLIVDGFERLQLLEAWLRDELFPSLPDRALIVVASRHAPSAAFLSDPGWQGSIRAMPLRNLNQAESHALLDASQVPADRQDAIVRFTHGHPLALALAVNVFGATGPLTFESEGMANLVNMLLHRFVDSVATDAHQRALEVCALARSLTEPLLAAVLDGDDAGQLFAWLRGLSFIEQGRDGIAPHEMAREALVADLRWRNPERHKQVHERIRKYYAERIDQVRGAEQQAMLQDYIFLHRDNPVVRPFFDWDSNTAVRPSTVVAADKPAILKLVERHEGREAAKIAARWMELRPNDAIAFRSAGDPADAEPSGFLQIVSLANESDFATDFDPAIVEAAKSVRGGQPLRTGETAAVMRFWMARDTYQAVSPVQSQIFALMVRHWIATPGPAKTYLPCSDPEFWAPLFEYGEHRRHAEADFKIGDRQFGMFFHDWRAMPPMAWLEVLAKRETGEAREEERPVAEAEVVVLSRDGLEDAVERALAGYAAPNTLNSNPLLGSRTVLNKSGAGASVSQRVAALRQVLVECAKSIGARPKDIKLLRALEAFYFKPIGTQEQAAEKLDISISSFRRHLKEGTERISEALWLREIGL